MIKEFRTQEEIMGLKSRKQLTRICYLLDKLCKEKGIEFIFGIDYLMAEAGYLKTNYTPFQSEDLTFISKLTYRYIKTYNKHYTAFVKDLLACYEYCKNNGYPKECNQTTLTKEV